MLLHAVHKYIRHTDQLPLTLVRWALVQLVCVHKRKRSYINSDSKHFKAHFREYINIMNTLTLLTTLLIGQVVAQQQYPIASGGATSASLASQINPAYLFNPAQNI